METVIVNGIPHEVLAETKDAEGFPLLSIRRPNGVKVSLARRLPDSPLYGAGRARIIAPMGFSPRPAREES